MDLGNYIYIIGASGSWFIAQGLKIVISLKHRYQGSISWQSLLTSGGMPSSHVSLVTTMVVLIGLGEGFDSALFGLTLAVWGVVIYDSMGVRRVTGENTQILRQITKQLKIGVSQKALFLALGHTPYQVLGGFIIGIIWSIFIYWLLN